MTKVKVSLFTVFIVLIITAIFLLDEFRKKNEYYESHIKEQSFMIQSFLNQTFSHQNRVYKAQLEAFANEYDFATLAKNNDMKSISKLMDLYFKQLKIESKYVDKFNFINNEGIAKYRAHDTKTNNDMLFDKRVMIKKAILGQSEVSGFEVGIFGLSYRIIIPIIKNNEFYGLLEVGISSDFFSDKIEDIFKSSTVDILVDKTKLGLSPNQTKLLSYKDFYFTKSEYKKFIEYFDLQNEKDIKIYGQYFHLIQNLKIKNIEDKNLFFSVVLDVTKFKDDFYYFVYKALFAFIVGGIFLYIIVFRALNGYELKLQEHQNELEKLNQTLKERIAVEVENNIKKDKLLITQGRSAAMGDMIANIAHQWRQPISSVSMILQNIMFDLDFLKDKPIDAQELSNELKKTTKILTEMSQIIDVFRDFFRPKAFQRFKLEDRIFEVTRLIESVFLTYGVKIKTNIIDKNVFVWGLPNEINQVLINVINNSRDQILLKEPENRTIEIDVFQDEQYGVVQIKDFAGGIGEDILEKIFEPYFTTKTNAQGTGIGLDMCKTILEKGNGRIIAKNHLINKDGKIEMGACFEVFLPLETNNQI